MSEPASHLDWRDCESTIVIRVRATKREVIDDWDHEHPKYGDDREYFETEGTLVFEKRLGNNLINIDGYLGPPADWLYDYANERTGNMAHETYYTGFSDVDVTFNVYKPELRKGAQKRAAEDVTSTERVLAEWLWQAGGKSHVSTTDARIFLAALSDHLDECDDPDDWALCYGGDPSNWTDDVYDSVTDIDEAHTYIKGGYNAVTEARDDD